MIATILKFPSRLAVGLLVLLIQVYRRLLSPLLGDVCRFEPSCSVYMIGALQKYGFFRGFGRGVKRICRCNPWCEGGYDPP